jgi:tRNA A-37 threonylcarbamoyl transferase component Bud32
MDPFAAHSRPVVGVGEVIADRYHVERVLGQGGMAYVVAATDARARRPVAIKFLQAKGRRDEEAVARFEREARTAGMVDSIHACRVFDVGRSEAHGLYLVMEQLAGDDLGTVVARGPLPVADAVGYIIQACDALAAAHAHGIVHRDLKPANLFLARQPDGGTIVKLLDFGVSKLIEQSAAQAEAELTPTIRIMGSLEYMSPEQVRSARRADQQSDVWSLGAILHELLTGRTPFEGNNVTALVINIVSREPASLLAARPDAPAELEPVIAHCLQREPSARTSSVGRLALELLPFAPGCGALVAGVVTRCLPWDRSLGETGVAPPVPTSKPEDGSQVSASALPSRVVDVHTGLSTTGCAAALLLAVATGVAIVYLGWVGCMAILPCGAGLYALLAARVRVAVSHAARSVDVTWRCWPRPRRQLRLGLDEVRDVVIEQDPGGADERPSYRLALRTSSGVVVRLGDAPGAWRRPYQRKARQLRAILWPSEGPHSGERPAQG